MHLVSVPACFRLTSFFRRRKAARPGRGRAPGPEDRPLLATSHAISKLKRNGSATVQARLAHLCSPPPRCPLARGFTARARRLLSSARAGHSRTVHGRDRPRTSCTPGWPASVGRIALRMSNPPHAPLPCFAPFFDSDRVVNLVSGPQPLFSPKIDDRKSRRKGSVRCACIRCAHRNPRNAQLLKPHHH